LADYWGNQVLDSKFKQDLVVKQIVDFDKEKITLRSSVAAKHILQNKVDVESIVDTMITMARISDRLSPSSPFHLNVKNLLFRFNSVQELLPEKGKRHEIIRFYENIKNLPSAKNWPLFWLQYAIACLVIDEFERAEKYFQVAYSLADDRIGFDQSYIDNQYARFLLIRATKQKINLDNAMSDFSEAHRISYAQSGKERRYFPYRVADMYSSFYDVYSVDMQKKHKDLIINAANEMLTRIYQLPRQRQVDRHVQRCESSLRTLLERASGVEFKK
jgi:tetratricopeptide (TPR) repeat protein